DIRDAHITYYYRFNAISFTCYYFFFFFFQAEDGIRDKLVTGVQTCALPICLRAAYNRSPVTTPDVSVVTEDLPGSQVGLSIEVRSEERRVGKECRCGWWTDH